MGKIQKYGEFQNALSPAIYGNMWTGKGIRNHAHGVQVPHPAQYYIIDHMTLQMVLLLAPSYNSRRSAHANSPCSARTGSIFIMSLLRPIIKGDYCTSSGWRWHPHSTATSTIYMKVSHSSFNTYKF